MIEQINYTYKLMKGADGHLYVSIQPLMKDIAKSITAMQKLDTNELNEEEFSVYELKIKALVTFYEFLGAFITEQQLRDANKDLKGNVAISTGTIQ